MLTKGDNPFRVDWSKFADGERMPFIVRSDTGIPIEAPTFWIVAHRRPTGRQPNTLANELRCVMFLYIWAELRGVDLLKRLSEGTFFTLTEIIDLVNVCGSFMDDLVSELKGRKSNVVRLSRRGPRSVTSDERKNRLASIYKFLHFTSSDYQSQLAAWPERLQRYSTARSECLDLIKSYRDAFNATRSDPIDPKEGLEDKAEKRVREVIEPDHADNPFPLHVRFRNFVIIRLLLDLGIRRGELLGIKIADYVPGSQATITIHRRPDDPEDDRPAKPATKTLARTLPLGGRLADLVHEWIVYHRSKIPNARRTPFLIVNAVDGRPMSLSNVNKMFETLRKKVPDLPATLAPHVLRHTWNDAFSKMVDETGVSPEEELQWRMRLMGWRGTETPALYQRRTTKRRANAASKAMQDKLDLPKGEESL